MFINGTTATSSNTGSSSLTFSATCDGHQRALVVGAMFYFAVGSGPSIGVTYSGVSMTGSASYSGANYMLQLFYLVNPSKGANDVVITASGPTANVIMGVATPVRYIDQTSPVGGSNSAFGRPTASTSVTTTYANSRIFTFAASYTTSGTWTYTHGASQVETADFMESGYSTPCAASSSYLDTTLASSYSVSSTTSVSVKGNAICAVELNDRGVMPVIQEGVVPVERI